MVSRAAAGAIAASLVLVGLVLVMALGDDPSGRPDGTGTAPPTLVLPDEPDAEAQAGAQRGPRLRLQPVARFARPVWLTQPPGDPRRLFVVEKGGRVRIVRGGRVLRRPFLSLRGKVSTRTEQGLLSLAFAPSYTRSRRFYVSYTDRRGALRVEEWRTRRSSPDRADPDSRRLVIRIPQPTPTHNGGHLVFGPEGLLYIGTGDGGGVGDPRRVAQNRGSLHGKILRIDPRATKRRRYRIPRSNPFVRVKGARDEVYAYGLRNPWRFAFDRRTSALVLGDVGQETFEELNYRPRARSAGANFGWSAYEGNRRFNRSVRARRAVAPMHTYARDRGCSVIGGPVVRDPGIPRLSGRMLYGDFCSGRINSIVPRAPRGLRPRSEGLRVELLSSFAEDRAGRIYAMSLTGPVYRLVAR